MIFSKIKMADYKKILKMHIGELMQVKIMKINLSFD